MHRVQLIVQPDDGVAPILSAVWHARKSIDLTVFRFNSRDVMNAIEAAVARGVEIRALIALANHGSEHGLRRLEGRLLEAGVAVSRASNHFSRYHAKMMIVDGRTLHVHSFNCTRLDLKSRSLGVVTTDERLVQQASRLFEADHARQPFSTGPHGLVVSPENARAQLEPFVHGARHELLIYDSRLNDRRFLRLLEARVKAGVDVRIIGHVAKCSLLHAEKLRGRRLHLRTIVRDRELAFVGSQSLRREELDSRREIGVFVDDPYAVRQLRNMFERDWPLMVAERAATAALDVEDLR